MSKLCVITGTSSGIGAALAGAVLEKNWRVVGLSRRPAKIRNDNYREFAVDLSDAEATEAFFEGKFLGEVVLGDYSRVALVNNSGTLGTVGPHERADTRSMVRDFTLNTVVPMWLGGFFIRHCPGARLYIVNISSGAANRPVAGWSTYCSSKAALKMAGQVAAEDLENYIHYGEQAGSVSIVSYSPGTVATAMQAEIRGHTPESFPRLPYFVGLHEKGELKSADLPAAEIAALLENDNLPAYNDVIYGE